MMRVILSCLVFFLILSPVAGESPDLSGIDPAVWQRYLALNEAETRLPDFKDSEADLAAKLHQLAYVNKSRARYKAAPVELDILASRVANRQSLEAAQNNFHGHWNLRGEKPYHRFAFAGGTDHVAENAAAYWTSGSSLDPTTAEIRMRGSHDSFMAEVAPADGHLQNVINKVHTHVGLGFAFAGQQFRYYEEFIDRYLDKLDGPTQAKAGETIKLSVVPKAGLFTYAILANYEAPLKPMTANLINAKGSYGDFGESKAVSLWPFDLTLANDGSTTVPLTFSKPGLYYINVYLDKTKPATSGSFSTNGKIQASGLVISVK